MALTNQLVPIVLTNGINQVVDEKVLQGALLKLENRVMTKAGRLDKRPGFRKLGNKTSTGATITSGNRVATFGDDLLLFDQDDLYSYVSSNDNWQSKGKLTTASVASQPYVRTATSQYSPDIAYLDGLVCAVWEETAGVKYSIFDDVSNSAVVSDALIDASPAPLPKHSV